MYTIPGVGKGAARALFAAASAACLLLMACGGGGSGGGDAASPPPATPASLGLMRITINGIGGAQMTSHADMLSGTSGPQAHVALPTAVPAGLDVQQVSASTVDVGTRGAGGERYFTVVYQVRNAPFCNTPGTCTPYTTISHNLTLVAANVPGNIADTAISNISLYDGSSIADTQALAPGLLPTHGMQFNTGTGAGVLVQPGLESLQVFTEDEVGAIPRDPGATDLFPYGYVVSNIHTPGSRALPASPANNQWDGEVSFSFKLPLQSSAKQDPYSITMIFQVIDDANTRVTESVEEQNPAGDIAADLRAATLSSVDLAVLGGRVAQTNIGDPICTVRTAGAAAAPTAYLANNAGISVGSAPFAFTGVNPSAPINVGFCAPMNAAGFSNFIVSGNQSGLRLSGGPYGGSYGANALNNVLSFTPDQPFLPGETVSYTLTTGLSGSGGGAVPRNFTGNYVVGGVVPSSASYVQSTPTGGGTGPVAVAVGDFNGDGKPDYAIVWHQSNAVQVRLNNGDGTFTAGPLITVATAPVAIATGDFNGDGHLDLMVASAGSPLIGQPSKLSLLVNNGAGAFSVAGTTTLPSSADELVVGDFNGDGHPDAAVTEVGGTLSIVLNDGSGHFTLMAPVSVGSLPTYVQAADFNGDGKLDLAVTTLGDSAVRALLNDGGANFTVGPAQAIGDSPSGMAAGDLNGDGIPDLAISTGATGFIRLLFGDGKGGFTAGGSLASGIGSGTVVIADLNGDGHPDLAAATSTLLGDGQGGFGAARAIPTAVNTSIAGAGDFNGDGRIDLVEFNNGANNVGIFTSQP
ncbi:FG-GAP repeat domain-containing protein [Nevskia soli]|uniref:FG-GAP repeat domain-containing protein n=1 Tax=Nevskia soli TaxID=418856 RepID=UPI0009FDB684|nr:VCBS repeat-containing protein [Nevskia soli]